MCSWVSYQAAAPTLCCIENEERNRPVVEKQEVEKVENRSPKIDPNPKFEWTQNVAFEF